MRLGINLSFAVKRLPEGASWAKFVREELGLDLVQFTFDLIDPWTPQDLRKSLAKEAREAAAEHDVTIHSAFTGLAAYSYNGLMHPLEEGREAAFRWWENAIALTAELGAKGIGGQLGGLSVANASEASTAEARYAEAFQSWIRLSQLAKNTGLTAMYIEPTPLEREFPHTVEHALQMAKEWSGETALPVKYAVDVGHAIYQPLYGQNAPLDPWLAELKDHIGLLHVQNTDANSDSHWGWPDERGIFDVANFSNLLRTYNLADKPVFIEVFYPFELADEAVLDNIRSTVLHCRTALEEV